MSTDFVKSFIAGGVGGSFTVMVGHPFDTVKVRLQTQPLPKPGEKPLYGGTLDCFKTTIAKDGLTVRFIVLLLRFRVDYDDKRSEVRLLCFILLNSNRFVTFLQESLLPVTLERISESK